jgi:branched-subunit amino acid transport protein
MENSQLILIVLGMSVVTFLPRVIPVGFLAGRRMPEWLVTWLKYVPISILSAMLVLDLAWKDQKINLHPTNLMLPSAALAFLVAARTRSLFGTVAAGMGALALFRLISN